MAISDRLPGKFLPVESFFFFWFVMLAEGSNCYQNQGCMREDLSLSANFPSGRNSNTDQAERTQSYIERSVRLFYSPFLFYPKTTHYPKELFMHLC